MKTLQERFEADYAAVEKPANNKDGFKIEYVYYAPWHLWDLPEAALKKCKRMLLGVSLLGLVFFIVAGIQECEANTRYWVAVPALLGLCAHVVELYGLILFNCAKYRTTRMTYHDVNWCMSFGPVARTGLLLLTGITSGYGVFLYGFSWKALTAWMGFLASAITALYVSRTYRGLQLRTERNTILEELEAQGKLH
ncbi:MAG: hypothetical protein IKT52_00035 [Oscillospiraceae bacterium]|nr:hypothetical protein [Oscillospiraceae bacterium]